MLKVRVISLPYIFHVLYVLCFTRPTYQVSVYRTIGPLVLTSSDNGNGFIVSLLQIDIARCRCALKHDEDHL